MGWRAYIIAATLIFAIMASAIMYWGLDLGHDPSTFFGAAFASWVAGLALFAVLGLMVAIVSLVRPAQEAFDARARILFRQQSGKHIDYIIKQIGIVLAHYNELTAIKIITVDHNTVKRKVRISCESKTRVKAYVDDITSSVESSVKLKRIAPPPPGCEANRIAFLRIDGVPQPGFTCDINRGIELPYNVTLEPHTVCEIDRCIQIWTKQKSEDNTYTAVRYTKLLTLEFENRLAGAIRVSLSKDAGATWQDHDIGQGDTRELLQISDSEPGKEIYRYRVTPL